MIDLTNLDKFNLDDYVKDTFIGFYQALFSQNKGEFMWDPDKNISKINIADQFSFDNEHPELKPLIYLRRRPLSFMNTSIDQLYRQNLITGATERTDLIAGTVEAVCVSSVELEACRLAGIVFMLTNAFRDELVAKSGLFKVDVKALGEAMPLNASSQIKLVEVPVVIQVMFTVSWLTSQILTDDNPVVSDIIVSREIDLDEYGKKLKDNCKNKDGVDGISTGGSMACVPITQL